MLKLTNARSGLPLWVNPFQVVSISRQTILDLNGPIPGAPVWTEVAVTNGAPVHITDDAEHLAQRLGSMLGAE